ncbi:unnamed protein product [Sphenostylis stenocarpa]|uniref:Uncharacterized protein n=1 Tax=Sphenostylis stenocarpa TaxID=92480 RepID=A0AA86VDK7_9FABA|nr:unnamed protein product [Sphenostylis stenocarpa]
MELASSSFTFTGRGGICFITSEYNSLVHNFKDVISSLAEKIDVLLSPGKQKDLWRFDSRSVHFALIAHQWDHQLLQNNSN